LIETLAWPIIFGSTSRRFPSHIYIVHTNKKNICQGISKLQLATSHCQAALCYRLLTIALSHWPLALTTPNALRSSSAARCPLGARLRGTPVSTWKIQPPRPLGNFSSLFFDFCSFVFPLLEIRS